MKKWTGLILAIVAAASINGCGGGGSDYNDGATTLFLVDENGDPYAGVPYACYENNTQTYSGSTLYNGEFTFYEGEDCMFDLYGYNGTDPNDGLTDDLFYIVDLYDNGKNGIPYECELFNVGTINYTYDDGIWDGSFDYDTDDRCVFYL